VKLKIFTLLTVQIFLFLTAIATSPQDSLVSIDNEKIGKTESAFSISGYASFDISTAYVSYGSRPNDEACYWSYGELNFSYDPLGTIGIALWQNTDMTTRRKREMRRMNEWDWFLYYRNDYAFSEDWRLNYETGLIWYKYHGLNGHEMRKAYAAMEEIYFKTSFDMPFLTPHFFASYDYAVTDGFYFEGGIKKESPLTDHISFTPNFIAGGGSEKYLSVLYPPWGGTGEDISHIQLSGTLAYWFNENFGVHAMLAYTVIVNDEIRGAIDDETATNYSKNYLWGTVGVDFAF
jgi:hypothetical protein